MNPAPCVPIDPVTSARTTRTRVYYFEGLSTMWTWCNDSLGRRWILWVLY